MLNGEQIGMCLFESIVWCLLVVAGLCSSGGCTCSSLLSFNGKHNVVLLSILELFYSFNFVKE